MPILRVHLVAIHLHIDLITLLPLLLRLVARSDGARDLLVLNRIKRLVHRCFSQLDMTSHYALHGPICTLVTCLVGLGSGAFL